MKLIEIDLIDAQTSQRIFALPPNGVGTQNAPRLLHRLPGIPYQTALGENVWSVVGAFSLEKTPNHFLGMTESVNGGGIDPVDAQLDGVIHGSDRIIVVLRSPRERPAAAANCPGAHSDACDVHVGGAELPNRKRRDHDAAPQT